MREIKQLGKNVKKLQEKLFKHLEIISKGEYTKTGKDVSMSIKGVDIIPILKPVSIDWKIEGPNTGVLSIIHCPTEDGRVILKDKDTILEEEIIIDYPIKKIDLGFRNIRIVSDNTGLNTQVYFDGKDITSKLGIASTKVYIGDADTISEVEMVFR